MAHDKDRQSVLVVDDSPDIHQLVGARLKSEGVELLHAHDSDEGMALALSEHPDLILLDLDMPGTEGMALCRQLKEDMELALIPVIFLTGTMDVETKVQAFDLGAVDYVTKPFDAVELKARVRAALRTKRYHDLLTTKAQIDALTGLWNRGYLNEQLTSEISLLQRNSMPVTLLMIDIDHFKPINDRFGHPVGDQVIQQVARVLNKLSRDSDVACRYGGDEFAVILRNTSTRGGLVLAERIREHVQTLTFSAGAIPVQATVSIGLAGSDLWAATAKLTSLGLLNAADKALYQAKTAGRNRVQ